MTEQAKCRHCARPIRRRAQQNWWEDDDGFTRCMKTTIGADDATNPPGHEPMPAGTDGATPIPGSMMGVTVTMVRALAPHHTADAVVITERPGTLPLEGGGLLDLIWYELQWPDGSSTWHLRHEFAPATGAGGGR